MKKGSKRFSIAGKPLYPHVKLTRERFPRILATRIIENDGTEYFGAFLNRTNARILIDFLNRTFRLRSCDIDVDGSFNHPCTMHYRGRCLAPCVSDLVDDDEYLQMVGLVRLFLLNDRPLFRSVITTKITKSSQSLDFEIAAGWRDILTAVEEYWADARHSVWLDSTSDTFYAKETPSGLDIFLISQKGRRVLGERSFSFEGHLMAETHDAISNIIRQFYLFHAPKEIRVPVELEDRREIESELRSRVGRRIPIKLLTEKNRKTSTELAVYRSSAELEVRRSQIEISESSLMREIRRSLKLPITPTRITAVDVSHISGSDQVAAAVSWTKGGIDPEASRSWVSDAASELGSLKAFLRLLGEGVSSNENLLLLVDGGPAQLRAAASVSLPSNVAVIAAVKPAKDHESISHFLTTSSRFEFYMMLPSHRLLHRLRDEAHDFANTVHRDTRDYAHYYRMAEILPSLSETERRKLLLSAGSVSGVEQISQEALAAILSKKHVTIAMADLSRYRSGKNPRIRPLVVPTRLQAENGAADDLRPIETVSFGKKRPR